MQNNKVEWISDIPEFMYNGISKSLPFTCLHYHLINTLCGSGAILDMEDNH